MNEEFFNYDLKELNKILETSELCSKEIKSRKTRLESNVKLIRETEERKYYNQYYQRAHEIRSILFLKQFGHLKIAEDYRNCQGCDFILNENTYIECVCSSEGIAEKNGLAPHLIFKDGVSYYNEKRNLLNARFTSSLCDKVDFYYKRVGNSIAKDKPFIIFISTGSLTNHWFKGNYAIALTDILFGRGNIRIEINTTTNEVIRSDYKHNDFLVKYNNEELDCNLFLSERFKCVSAILLSTVVGEEYTNKNTFLFVNPFAQYKIHVRDFYGIVYWKADRNGYYSPYCKGKSLNQNL